METITKRKKDRYKAKSVVVAYCSRIGKYVVTIEDLYILRFPNSIAFEAKKHRYWVIFSFLSISMGKISISYIYIEAPFKVLPIGRVKT